MSRALRQLAFVLYPGVTPLDLVGPLTVLRDLRLRTPYRTVVVGGRAGPHPSDTALGLVPAATYDDVPAPFALFLPGGGAATLEAMRDEGLLAYVRSAAARAEIVGATGNGALILGAAGLLGGRRVAIHWAFADLLAPFGATAVQEPWIQDGRLLTAAGGVAGIDAMLQLTERLTSRRTARLAQYAMEYDPQPPFTIDRDAADDGLSGLLRGPSTTGALLGALR
jgi:transcriptional regulator GlxA family with amidase domain